MERKCIMGVDTHKVEVVPVVLEKHPNADKLSVVRVYNFTCVVNTADWQGVTQAAYVQPDSVMPDKPEYRFLKETGNIKKEREALWTVMQAEHESDLARLDYDMKLAELEKRVDSNTKRLRITVVKLRGVISMGMLLPIPECELCKKGLVPVGVGPRIEYPTLETLPPEKFAHITEDGDVVCTNRVKVGDDVAEVLGVTHYEPPTADELDGARKHAGDDVAPAPPMIYAPKYDVESVYKFADCFEIGEPVYVS